MAKNVVNSYYEEDKFYVWLGEHDLDTRYRGYIKAMITKVLAKTENLCTIFEERNMMRAMNKKKRDDTIAKLEDLLDKVRKAAALRKKKFGKKAIMGDSTAGSVQSYCSALDQYIHHEQVQEFHSEMIIENIKGGKRSWN